ncbi:MAG: hypothetical protein KJT01_02200 [Gemmatimonadetes bacterium]|nr:hypothetical protein [Gemmatimonadota bacterium]
MGRALGAACGAAAWVAGLSAAAPRPAPAQAREGSAVTVGAMATAVATHVAPALLGASRTEGYLTQPALMGDLRGGPWRFTGTVNLEGLTLRRGELTLGSYGEGYVDRRHPHTLVHEAMGAAVTPAGRRWQGSLAAGKGFVPFGTDDPMMRPFVKFPVNHHHAQLPERAQVIAAVRLGPSARALVLEQAWHNGDEPTGPWAWPRWRRVGDSRATRLTAQHTAPGGARWELQGSRAFVRSPGIIQGGAFDHAQQSVSLRYARADDPRHGASAHAHGAAHAGGHEAGPPAHGLAYLLVEAARTDEGADGVRAFRYESVLAEAQWRWHGWGVAVRGERTDRPEPERLLDLYRTATGHIDFQIVGITRFDVVTAQLTLPPSRWWALQPFAEVAAARPVARRRPAVFDPPAFYGARTQWMLSTGVRLHAGRMRPRMGRYGVLAP